VSQPTPAPCLTPRNGRWAAPFAAGDTVLTNTPTYEVVINSIAATTTSTGLKVYARLDERDYPKKIAVTDAQLAAVNLTRDEFHPEWNYSIAPSS